MFCRDEIFFELFLPSFWNNGLQFESKMLKSMLVFGNNFSFCLRVTAEKSVFCDHAQLCSTVLEVHFDRV